MLQALRCKMGARSYRLGRHLALGVSSAAVVGLVEGGVALGSGGVSGASAWAAPLLAAAVMLPAGVLLGLGSALLARALPARVELTALRRDEWLGPALALAGFAAGLAWAAGGYVRFAGRLQDEEFAADLAGFYAVLACAALAIFGALLARGLSRPLHALARIPERARARLSRVAELGGYALLATWLWGFSSEHADLLGPLFVLPYACLLAVALGVAFRVLPIPGARSARVLWGCALVGFGVAAPALSALHGADAVVRRTLGPSRVSALLARLADVDRDGQAGVFGGRDCAPFDPRRGPLALDTPGNRIDEDCSGRDARPRTRAGGARAQSAALPAALVGRHNVLLVVVDALRADRLGLGKKGSLTPVLDRLAARSVVFTEAFSQSPSTRVSFPSFLTGMQPVNLKWKRWNGWMQTDGQPTLAELLHDQGYTTGLVINAWIRDRLTQLQRGYDFVLNIRRSGGKPVSPALAGPSSTARAIEFVEQAVRRKKPFFLTVYYEGPHAPYDDLRAFGVRPRGNRPIDFYEGEVRYTDQQIGHLLEHFSVKRETAAATVVIVLADHGEEFGEHGGKHHDRECYRESTHVPLIVHAPGVQPARVSARVGLTSVVPTVLALLGAPAPAGLDGRNLIAADPAGYARAQDEPLSCVYFADQNPSTTQIQALRDAGYLYIERFGRGPSELYDTRADRGEREDLANDPARSGAAAELRRKISPLQLER